MALSVTWKSFRQSLVLSRRGHVENNKHFFFTFQLCQNILWELKSHSLQHGDRRGKEFIVKHTWLYGPTCEVRDFSSMRPANTKT